jgi:hypothetical protein
MSQDESQVQNQTTDLAHSSLKGMNAQAAQRIHPTLHPL